MIRINLIPETRRRNYSTPLIRHAILLAVLCFGALSGVEYYSDSIAEEIKGVETKIAEQKEVEKNLKKVIEKSNEIRERTEATRKRASRIKELGEGRKLSVMFLDNLQMKHPERMWFTKVAVTGSGKNITLSGFALDHTVIADYIKRIKEIGKIDTSEIAETQKLHSCTTFNQWNCVRKHRFCAQQKRFTDFEPSCLACSPEHRSRRSDFAKV